MLAYKDIDARKSAFILELDDVLFPEKDYLLQVYYLFANFIEFTEGSPPAADVIAFMQKALHHHGSKDMFHRVAETFAIDSKYAENFDRLHYTARLPLKLLIQDKILALLQEIAIDRKKIFVVTNGNIQVQVNKIMQTDWRGLEKYIEVYYAEEIKPKPDPDVLTYILEKHNLKRRDVVVIGNSLVDQEFASTSGVDFIFVSDFL